MLKRLTTILLLFSATSSCVSTVDMMDSRHRCEQKCDGKSCVAKVKCGYFKCECRIFPY